jgi:hypothetical protein
MSVLSEAMSERRRADEMTDPGPPPEEALDATLRALGAPVPAQARRTAESAGLDAAHYHAEPHRPPKAHEAPSSSKVAITAKMAPAVQLNIERDTIRMEPRAEPREQATVPRAKPVPSRMSTFLGALAFVVLVLGVATWALMRGGSAPERAATASSVGAGTASSAAVVVVAPAPTLPAATAATAVAATAAIAPASTAPAALASDTSSATTDPPRPTGRPQPGTTAASSAAPRHPTAATPGSPASSPLPAIPTTAAAPAAPLAPPAPTTKYNRFLEEDKK